MHLPLQYAQQRIIHSDILDIDASHDATIGLIVTSPPCIFDGFSYDDYLEWSKKWLKRCYYLAAPRGRLCLNIPIDVNLDGYRCLGSDLTGMAQAAGWQYRSTIIWQEDNISKRTAWGSFASASTPNIITPSQVIVVFFKDEWNKGKGISDISPVEFKKWSLGIWQFNGEHPSRVDHPSAFPLELPRRCIRLFSYVDDVIFDPFLGSGTTLIACQALGRPGKGCEIDLQHVKNAMHRLQKEWQVVQWNWQKEVAKWAEIDQKDKPSDLMTAYLERKQK